jgi:hypothetical protein
MCVLIMCTSFMRNIFYILRRIQRDVLNINMPPACKIPVIFCQILIKLELFDRFSKNIKYYKNPFSWSRIFSCKRTDRDMTKLTVAFHNFATPPKKVSLKWPVIVYTRHSLLCLIGLEASISVIFFQRVSLNIATFFR